MPNGLMGKILRVDLSSRTITYLNTSDYEAWGGGHGYGSAIFWDLVIAPGNPLQSASNGWDMRDGFDSRNVLTLMVSPASGTFAPSIGGRTEVQAVSPYAAPEWYNRSGFGGRFSTMLKYAGFDGIVVEGKASSPVWINIVNDEVTLEDAGPDGDNLWGLDTWETQQEIWRRVGGTVRFGEWQKLPGGEYTTQRPAVVTIGPAGENLTRVGALVHDGGSGAGHTAMGSVFGSKNLKAISVLGTQSVEIADPLALMDARTWFTKVHHYNTNDPIHDMTATSESFAPGRGNKWIAANRVSACQGCGFGACRRRNQSGTTNDSQCADFWYSAGTTPQVQIKGTNLMQRSGINAFALGGYLTYTRDLIAMGVAGPGMAIDTNPLPFDLYGTLGFAENFLHSLSHKEGIGEDYAEGIWRASERWGRLQEDLESGLLKYPQWGFVSHWTLPGIEWAYGCLMGERDINEHDFSFAIAAAFFQPDRITAEKYAEIVTDKMIPYAGDRSLMDYSYDNLYTTSKAKLVAWHRSYTRFWKQSIGTCCWCYFNSINPNEVDMVGASPEAEERFLNAITGKNASFADGMEVGRKIWNLDRAIWILQPFARHRDMEKFSGYMFTMKQKGRAPTLINGEWSFNTYLDEGMVLDYDGVEEWKTNYYDVEGWDNTSGWPTRATLAGLGLSNVADVLEDANKLGT